MSLATSNTIIAICLMVITLAIFAAVIGLIWALVKFRALAQQGLRDAKPVMNQATNTLKSVTEITDSVKGRVDHIMYIAESTADNVSRKVQTTSSMITETISPPLISLSSVVTGVSRGLEVWSLLRKRGNGREG